MNERLLEIFDDKELTNRIKTKLPHLYRVAELECSRAGKIGMEVGSVREKIIVALLIYKFGEENVKAEIPITFPEVDAMLFDKPISIKTITGERLGGVKLIWTVDAPKAKEFLDNYYPCCDIILVQIVWGGTGGFYYIPLESQRSLFEQIGKENYIKLPKPGTNPRGVEITQEALFSLTRSKDTKFIKIAWARPQIDYHPYKRWVDYWREE